MLCCACYWHARAEQGWCPAGQRKHGRQLGRRRAAALARPCWRVGPASRAPLALDLQANHASSSAEPPPRHSPLLLLGVLVLGAQNVPVVLALGCNGGMCRKGGQGGSRRAGSALGPITQREARRRAASPVGAGRGPLARAAWAARPSSLVRKALPRGRRAGRAPVSALIHAAAMARALQIGVLFHSGSRARTVAVLVRVAAVAAVAHVAECEVPDVHQGGLAVGKHGRQHVAHHVLQCRGGTRGGGVCVR